MSKQQTRFLQKQKMAVAGFAIVILAIVAYLFIELMQDTPLGNSFVEGEHYFLLDEPRRIRGEKIEIMEFFSYGCIHCANFDAELHDWVAEKGEAINFIQTPVIASELWRTYGRAFYTMKSLNSLADNHTKLFREVHQVRRNLSSGEKLATLLTDDADSKTAFINTFNSALITKEVNKADKLARRFKIATVPNLVVNGKYLVRSSSKVGLSRMLDVMDYLIELETAKKQIK